MPGRLRSALANLYHTLTDRRFREYNAQRRITDPEMRKAAADRIAAGLPQSAPSAAKFDSRASAVLNQQGWLPLEGLVTPDEVEEIRAYFAPLTAQDPYRPELGSFVCPEQAPAHTHVAHYGYDQILAAPHLLRIANDPRVLGPVEAFLGGKPTLSAIRVWWSLPSASGEPEHAENFHRDVDDLRFIKLFVYLTEVDEEAGPHIYVPATHNRSELAEIRRYEEHEVAQAFGAENIRQFVGKAGTSFLENTYGLHRGLPARSAPRLIFQPLYTLRPVIYGPKVPPLKSAAKELGLDPYINRVMTSG